MIVELAPAKLNLALHVRRRRADGYHDLETVFAFCGDGDKILLETADQTSLTIEGPFAGGLDTGAGNLVIRAERAFCAAFARSAAHRIVLDKRLPIASGIGGGSADAAATLRALGRLHGIDADAMGMVAAGLGADVPACLLSVTAIGTGRGDALEPIAPLGGMSALLVNPGVAVSTAAVFAGWDGVDRGAFVRGDTLASAIVGRNDLEPPARAIAPAIDEALAMLAVQPGVRLARMSGSGATCFALFDTLADRDAAALAVARARPDWWRLASVVA